jgi:hypothetical protein
MFLRGQRNQLKVPLQSSRDPLRPRMRSEEQFGTGWLCALLRWRPDRAEADQGSNTEPEVGRAYARVTAGLPWKPLGRSWGPTKTPRDHGGVLPACWHLEGIAGAAKHSPSQL